MYNLYLDGQIAENFSLVAVGRRHYTEDSFRKEVTESIKANSRANNGSLKDISKLVSSFYYFEADINRPQAYKELKLYLDELDNSYGAKGNRVYYLAVSPEHFETIVENISINGMSDQSNGFKRVVIEKPFGRDLATARKLNSALEKGFSEEQIYRIDHYLGKEMLQNIMVIRFANTMFEPLWSNKYIDHVQITSSETIGVENRGGYYDQAGAIRDMMQNHMLQLLMLTAMEAPHSLDTDSIRDEKVKVLRALSLP
ncbi:MAG: glucose-6-phosphate dehydrogenase, partial [Eubacteriales bacterium]